MFDAMPSITITLVLGGMLIQASLPTLNAESKLELGMGKMKGEWNMVWTRKGKGFENFLATISDDQKLSVGFRTFTLVKSVNGKFPSSEGWYRLLPEYGIIQFLRLSENGTIEGHYFDEGRHDCNRTYHGVQNYCSAALGTRNNSAESKLELGMGNMKGEWNMVWTRKGKGFSNFLATISDDQKLSVGIKTFTLWKSMNGKFLPSEGWYQAFPEDGVIIFLRLSENGTIEVHYFNERRGECNSTYHGRRSYCSAALGTRNNSADELTSTRMMYRPITTFTTTSPSIGLCGGEMVRNVLKYPNSTSYNNSIRCKWTIERDYSFLLKFKKLFDIEKCRNCRCDYVRVGNEKKVCGSDIPKKVYRSYFNRSSAQSYNTITFESDNAISGRGFKIEIIKIRDPLSTGTSNENAHIRKYYTKHLQKKLQKHIRKHGSRYLEKKQKNNQGKPQSSILKKQNRHQKKYLNRHVKKHMSKFVQKHQNKKHNVSDSAQCNIAGAKYVGFVVRQVAGVSTWEKCRNYCRRTRRCKLWTLTSYGVCNMRRSPYVRIEDGSVSGPKYCVRSNQRNSPASLTLSNTANLFRSSSLSLSKDGRDVADDHPIAESTHKKKGGM